MGFKNVIGKIFAPEDEEMQTYTSSEMESEPAVEYQAPAKTEAAPVAKKPVEEAQPVKKVVKPVRPVQAPVEEEDDFDDILAMMKNSKR